MSGATKRRQLADQLIADIRTGRYKPGDRLPSVRSLVDSGQGESTVLAAFRLLVNEAWVETRGTLGRFVADPLPTEQPAVRDVLGDHERRLAEIERRLGPAT